MTISCYVFFMFKYLVLRVLDRRGGLVIRVSPCEQEVMGSIPGRDKPKSFKLVVVASPVGAQDYGNSTTTCPPVLG